MGGGDPSIGHERLRGRQYCHETINNISVEALIGIAATPQTISANADCGAERTGNPK
jgi:hypothetical protein